MKEYVCRICLRDPDHPLTEGTILEFGTVCTDARAFADALSALVQLLRLKGTPEKTAEFMVEQRQAAGIRGNLIPGMPLAAILRGR